MQWRIQGGAWGAWAPPKKEEGWAVPVGSTLVSLARLSHRGRRRWCVGHLIAEECAVVLYVRVVRDSRAGVVQR